jgi:hypothetical protein
MSRFGGGMHESGHHTQSDESDDSESNEETKRMMQKRGRHVYAHVEDYESDASIPADVDQDSDDPVQQPTSVQPTSVGVIQLLNAFEGGEDFAELDAKLLTQKGQHLVSEVFQPWTRKFAWSGWFGGRNQTISINGGEVPSDQEWFGLAAKAHQIIMAASQAKKHISTPAQFEVC